MAVDEIILTEPQITVVTTDVRKVRILNYEITDSSASIILCKVDLNGREVIGSLRRYDLTTAEFTDFMNNTVKQIHVGMERGNYIKQAIRLYVKNKLQI